LSLWLAKIDYLDLCLIDSEKLAFDTVFLISYWVVGYATNLAECIPE
jgi:hypothetical protein